MGEYNISLECILFSRKIYLKETRRINIYNMLYQKWLQNINFTLNDHSKKDSL